MSFNSLPLEGKVGGELRRSDEVAKFYLSKFNNIRLYFFTSSVACAPASPQGEALVSFFRNLSKLIMTM